jgi:hypothetical protein
MSNHKLKFYPVNNGDTVLITLKDETPICLIPISGKQARMQTGIKSIKKKGSNYHLDL